MKLLCLLPAALILSGALPAQQIKQERFYRENIVLTDTVNGYYCRTVVQSETTKKNSTYIIPSSGIRKVYKCRISYFNEDGKLKKYRDANLREYSSYGMYFISSRILKCFDLPENGSFQVKYESELKDLIMLSDLPFKAQYPVDTFYYELKFPESLNIKYRLEQPLQLKYFSADSVFYKGQWTYSFKASARNPVYSEKPDNSPYELRHPFPQLLMIITPSEYKGKESLYLNRWLRSRYQASMVLGDEGKNITDSITKGIVNHDSIILNIFRFVRDRIKYVTVDTGFSGIIPTPAFTVIRARQGDCKAMSNLLACMISYKGLNARVGLIGVDDAEADFNFPSMACGNHMICVTEDLGKMRFLDATSKNSDGIIPDGRLENRTVFLLSPDLPQYVKIPVTDPYLNREISSIVISNTGGEHSGLIRGTLHGSSMSEMQSTLSGFSSVARTTVLKRWLQAEMKTCSFSDVELQAYGDSCNYHGKFSLGGSAIFRNGNTTYLSLDFLPRPISILNEAEVTGDLLFPCSIYKKVNLEVDMGFPIASCSLENIDINEGGFSFSLKSFILGKKLNITYTCLFNGVDYPYENRDAIILFGKKLQKTFNNVISIH